jgi:hypothetical protein
MNPSSETRVWTQDRVRGDHAVGVTIAADLTKLLATTIIGLFYLFGKTGIPHVPSPPVSWWLLRVFWALRGERLQFLFHSALVPKIPAHKVLGGCGNRFFLKKNIDIAKLL